MTDETVMRSAKAPRPLLSACYRGDISYWATCSLFHQILGVDFFQFTQALFKIFVWNFFGVILSPSPNIAENFVEFGCIFFKLDNLACNKNENEMNRALGHLCAHTG